MPEPRRYNQSIWPWLAAATYDLIVRCARAIGLAPAPPQPEAAPAVVQPPAVVEPEPVPPVEAEPEAVAPEPPAAVPDDRLNLAGIATLAGFAAQDVANWRSRFDDFPPPSENGFWEREAIETWLREHPQRSTEILSFINLKGGVGKTTTAIAVAEILAHEDRKRVLLIDLDPQTNATVSLITEDQWADMDRAGRTVAQLFDDHLNPLYPRRFDIGSAIARRVSTIGHGIEFLDLLPSSIRLIDIQERIPMIAAAGHFTINPLDVLSTALRSVTGRYDFIIIDCPPSLGTVTKNGLRISTGYVIPTIPDTLSTWGIYQIVDNVDRFALEMQLSIPPLGIVATKVQSNNLHARVVEDLRGQRLGRFGENGRLEQPKLFENAIPQSVAVARSSDVLAGFRTLRQKYGDPAYTALHGLTQEIKERCAKKRQ